MRYDVAAETVTVERATGREEHARERLRLLPPRARRLRADAPELPFDFVGGFAGYLGYELKAECGDRVADARRSPTPRSCCATGSSPSTIASAGSTCSP